MRWPFKYPKVKVIPGCDGDPYLTRITLMDTRWGSLKIHNFHWGDEDKDLHDHPWPFVSVILRGGYWEEVPSGVQGLEMKYWKPPFSVLSRPAHWTHGVRLRPGTEGKVWTLVWMGRRCREWGFHTPLGWMHWREYIGSKHCVD